MFLISKPGLRYVKRQGGVPWDYQTPDFPVFDASTAKDISAIVPANAKIVHLHVYCIGAATNQAFGFRPEGFTSAAGYANVPVIVSAVANEANLFIPIGPNGIVEYYRCEGINTATMTVLGWFI